jgi:DNA-binding response OmpR family regulator/methylphosphotriester-DNA--protein-cysteine methyltransferase
MYAPAAAEFTLPKGGRPNSGDSSSSSSPGVPSSILGAPRAKRLLWIDDEVFADDPSVKCLQLAGFKVDCARCGLDGLRCARLGAYDLAIVDLRLPDMEGLEVLGALHVGASRLPVLVLTGFGDVSTAVAAIRLGARDFRLKPVWGDELVDIVCTVIADDGEVLRHRVSGEYASHDVETANWSDRTAAIEASPWRAHLAQLLVALLEHGLDLPVFAMRANAFRALVAPAATAAGCSSRSGPHGGVFRPLDGRVAASLGLLQRAALEGTRPSENAVAAGIGVDPAHLGRLIKDETGLGFRMWRSTAAVQVAVGRLRAPDARVSEIAYALGFEHAAQFAREFRRIIGISPREYQQLAIDPNC